MTRPTRRRPGTMIPGVRLVLLGRQGAGKGTQCVAAVAPLRRPAHLHRRHAPRGREGGHRVRPQGQGVHGRGELVPDDVMVGIVDERLPSRRRRNRGLHPRRLPPHGRPGRGAGRHIASGFDRPGRQPRRAPSTWSPSAWSRRGPGRRHRGGHRRAASSSTRSRPSRHRLATAPGTCSSTSTASATATTCSQRLVTRSTHAASERSGRVSRCADDQIAIDAQGRRVVAEMHERIRAAIRPGRHHRRARRSRPRGHRAARAPLELPGYGTGVPRGDLRLAQRRDRARHPRRTVLDEGDIISIDCGAIIEGWHGDAAFTVPRRPDHRRGAAAARGHRGLARGGIEAMVDGNRLCDIGAAVQGVAEARRVRGGARVRRPRHRHGHARGARRSPTTGRRARARSCGGQRPRHRAHGQRRHGPRPGSWTTAGASSPRDGRRSAHFEHTIAVTDDGPEILTLP